MDEGAFVTALKSGSVEILAKPSAKKTEIAFDKEKRVWRVSIAAPAEDNEANIELVKFLSKIAGKPVRILSGLTSKRKVVRII